MILATPLNTERTIMFQLPVAAEPFCYALLRIGYGATLATHGFPKLLGTSHGSMADPMAGSTRLIETALGLPFAPQTALLIALLEGVGGPLLAIGVATRPLAILFLLQMIGICVALGPTYPWIDRGIEYPIILGLVAGAIAARGSGPLALEASAKRLLPRIDSQP
jgi:putative oxidoreductase